MLNGITNHFHLITKVGSFGAKVIAIGMTGFGLRKLWSKEAAQTHSLTARIAFSSAYILHMAAISIATATCFGAGPLSAATATALVGGTSLLTSYANFMETYILHSLLKAKYSALENQLHSSNLDLQRSLALFESVSECDMQIKLLETHFAELEQCVLRLKNSDLLAPSAMLNELKAIYISIESQYREKIKKNEIIDQYFKDIQKTEFNPNTALNKIRDQIADIQQEISLKKGSLQKKISEKTKSRLQAKIDLLDQKMNDFGIINIQCIRYKKIEEHIRQLQTLLQEVEQTQRYHSPAEKLTEKSFLEDRIRTLQSTLSHLMQFHILGPTLDLDLGMVVTLDERIEDDPHQFKSWLKESLEKEMALLEGQIKTLQESTEKIQICFKTFIKNPTRDIQNHRLQIREIKQAMITLQCDLSLEKFSEESRKSKMNLSSITSITALLLCFISNEQALNLLKTLMLECDCLIPNAQASSLLKTLMLGCGIIGSGSSLWGFYQKNLLTKQVAHKQQNQTQRLNKELAFVHAGDLQRTQSAQLKEFLERPVDNLAKDNPIEKSVVYLHEERPVLAKPLVTQFSQNKKNPTTIVRNFYPRVAKDRAKKLILSIKTKVRKKPVTIKKANTSRRQKLT